MMSSPTTSVGTKGISTSPKGRSRRCWNSSTRAALRNGLKLEQELGVNPYKFGMIGSTDAHTGLAAIDQDNFWGKMSNVEPNPNRATHPWVKTENSTIMGWEQAASGYAGVWATDNTREALFDAMQRKEVYATTGPRHDRPASSVAGISSQ